jgi:hypothetical protein
MPNKQEVLTDKFIYQLANLWIVAQCRCMPMKAWHSNSHLDCFSVDPWLIDEFRNCAESLVKEVTDGSKT